jgi:hypothetical protein
MSEWSSLWKVEMTSRFQVAERGSCCPLSAGVAGQILGEGMADDLGARPTQPANCRVKGRAELRTESSPDLDRLATAERGAAHTPVPIQF